MPRAVSTNAPVGEVHGLYIGTVLTTAFIKHLLHTWHLGICRNNPIIGIALRLQSLMRRPAMAMLKSVSANWCGASTCYTHAHGTT